METMSSPTRRSPLALALLALLIESPMHPYRMQRLIKQRGKADVINVGQRASLYKTIDRLRRDGLVRVRETERDAQRPERTVYEVTDAGRVTARAWMRDILSTPRSEFPEFPVGIAYLPLLDPDDVVQQLTTRTWLLSERLSRLEGQLREYADVLPRLFVLEVEYLTEMTRTELRWVTSLIDDVRSDRVHWDDQWIASVLKEQGQAGPTAVADYPGAYQTP